MYLETRTVPETSLVYFLSFFFNDRKTNENESFWCGGLSISQLKKDHILTNQMAIVKNNFS
jgi:hypothetical protein